MSSRFRKNLQGCCACLKRRIQNPLAAVAKQPQRRGSVVVTPAE
jgi:hypothetical protein